MKKILFILLLGLAISVPSMAGAVPAFPMNFWGNVTINGDDAPNGSVIGAYNASDTLIAQFTVATTGAYGSEDRTVAESAKLSISEYTGDSLTFKLNSPSYDNNAILADTQSYVGAFQAENHQNKNLAFTGATPNSAVTSIAVTPASPSITVGNTQQFTATATYYDTTTADITTSCVWTSSSTGIATIGDNTGLATGVTAGSTTITAAYTDATNGALSDTAALTVTATGWGGSPGGGSTTPSAPAMPTSTDGDVTATRVSGGKTTITTSEGVEASVKIPAYAIDANTDVSIESKAATSEGLGTVFAVMTGDYTIVGNYVYEITASSNGSDVTEFSKKLTITLTYTDAQISGLTEISLTISYWDADEEKWFALPTTVDKATNTLTARTDHLTYFAILSGLGESVVVDDDKPVSEMTQAEIRAAIAEIIVKIKQLQAILAQMRGESMSVSGCAITSFDRALKSGMSGTDVKCLQLILNSAADTQIASSGVGSSGQETNYFGGLTKAGVIKFQEKYTADVLAPHGLTSGTGYVGTTTRAQLNTLLK
jgi:uncharacterized protein YjdB